MDEHREGRVLKVAAPFTEETVAQMRSGDRVLITGRLLTARDAAHKRLYELIMDGKPLPVDLNGQVIYYVGPTPPRPGMVIGSAGPTTSGRVDKFTPALLERGVKGLIGKGYRSQQVKDALVKNRCVYLVTTGGTGALLSKRIKASRVVAWEDLGTEAIRELVVEEFPAVVIHDIYGGDAYAEGQRAWQREESAVKA